MSKIHHTLIGVCVAAASLSVMAQAADEHKAHHPAGSTQPASTQMKTSAKPMCTGPMAGMAKMDEHMKSMQAMHEKMMAAKTPEERQALMDEHMKLMQSGMATMGAGSSGGMGMGMMQQGAQTKPAMPAASGNSGMGGMMGMHAQMERRMAMMEQMMQMMVDRQAAMPSK